MSTVSSEGSNGLTIISDVRMSRTRRNSSLISGVHTYSEDVLSRDRILMVDWLRSGMKPANCWAKPRKERSSETSFGAG